MNYYVEKAGQLKVGVEHAIRQVEGLIDRGVPGLHFYVLNKSQATRSVLAAVGRPAGAWLTSTSPDS